MSSGKVFNKNFILLFQGQFVSQIGAFSYMVAIMFWLKHVTDSATMVGLLMVAATLPGVLLGPFGGTLADMLSRKKIIVWGDMINGVFMCFVAISFLFFNFPLEVKITMVYMLAIMVGVIGAIFRPAVNASIPDLVNKEGLQSANSTIQLSTQIAQMLGQGVGGVLFRVVGAPVVMLINGLSYIFSAISEIFISLPANARNEKKTWRETAKSFRSDTTYGINYVNKKQGMKDIFLIIVISEFFIAPLVVLLPFYIEETLRIQSDWYGLIISSLAVGIVVGNIMLGLLKVSAEQRAKTIVAANMLLAISYMSLGVTLNAIAACILMFLIGACLGIQIVLTKMIIQLATAAEVRGRVFGLLGTLSSLDTLIAMGVTGVLVDMLSRETSVFFIGAGSCLLTVTIWMAFNRQFQQICREDYVPEETVDEVVIPAPAELAVES